MKGTLQFRVRLMRLHPRHPCAPSMKLLPLTNGVSASMTLFSRNHVRRRVSISQRPIRVTPALPCEDTHDSDAVHLHPRLIDSSELRLEGSVVEKRLEMDPALVSMLKDRTPSRFDRLKMALGYSVVLVGLVGMSLGLMSGRALAVPNAGEEIAESDRRSDSDGSETSSRSRAAGTAEMRKKRRGLSKEGAEKKEKSSSKKRNRKESSEERARRRREKQRAIKKKGRWVDPYKSTVADPLDLPYPDDPEVEKVMSLWRLDKLEDLTYTQFWQLVRDGHIASARYSRDERTLIVEVMDSAPGGERRVKIGLPYDPDLYNHLLKHDVFIERPDENPLEFMLFMLIRLAFPILISYSLVQFSFRVGKKENEDEIFGGANLDMMHAKESKLTFADIAGVDQIKDEIKEVVAFLKNPKKFTDMGAKSPAGMLLVGPPGSGKTLLAKAIAGETRVPFFSTAGTEFSEMYVGVGASRVRDMFQKTRDSAPCILFIDEFDAIGQKRSADGTDESVNTINQLLTEMDGFEDNTGVVVIAATNRPNALDSALTRPGRFDRVIHLPLPNVKGREEILRVHSRDKLISPDVEFNRVARATAGFTGAQLMNLMNQSAIFAVRQRRELVTEADIFEALEVILMEKRDRGMSTRGYDTDIIPPQLRKNIAIYEAGKCLVGLMSPSYDEVYKVSVCPGGIPTGSTFFLPREERLESRVVTRGYMETRLVVCLAGRVAERLLLGDANVSTAGTADLNQANAVAKEMIYRCGFSKQLGPVALMDTEDSYLADSNQTKAVANISTDIARIAFEECRGLLDSAEAKAYYGLATNFPALEALVELLSNKELVGRADILQVAEEQKIVRFSSPFTAGFGWDSDGRLLFPDDGRTPRDAKGNGVPHSISSLKRPGLESWWDPANPYELRWDLQELLHNQFPNETN